MWRRLGYLVIIASLSSCSAFNSLVGIEEEKVDFPPGEYIGTAKLVKAGEEKPSETITEKIKINFIPKDPGITDGVGVLTMEDESQRFYWRSDGNNTDTWNVLFTKDNNLYTNLQNSFKFDGILVSKETENKLEGRLYFDYDSDIRQYFVETAQVFKPVIIPPKETISIKAGDSFDVQVEKAGEEQEKLKVELSKSATEKEPAVNTSLAIKQMASDKGITTLSLATDKSIAKGDYSLRITRDDQRSNSIAITVN